MAIIGPTDGNAHAPFADADERAYFDAIVAKEKEMLAREGGGFRLPHERGWIDTQDATYDP